MKDTIKRYLLNNEVIVTAASTKNLVNEARVLHNTYPTCTAALGRTLTGTAMMASTSRDMDTLFTVTLNGGGPAGTVLATANGRGEVKGYIENPYVNIPARSEVVARGRSNHGLGRELDAGIEVDGLLQVLLISRGAVICELGTIVEAIVEAEVPRYREVVVLARHPLSSHCGVELAIGVAPRVEVLGRERGDVVTRNLSSIFA